MRGSMVRGPRIDRMQGLVEWRRMAQMVVQVVQMPVMTAACFVGLQVLVYREDKMCSRAQALPKECGPVSGRGCLQGVALGA